MKTFFLLLACMTLLHAKTNFTLIMLDTYEYKSKRHHELSALAYDGKKLYALSDSGVLLHCDFSYNQKNIEHFSIEKSYKLKNKNGKELAKNQRDSEGLVCVEDALYISFEQKPRVEKFSLNGKRLKKVKIHRKLRDIDNYVHPNKGLEALAYHPSYGVISAPEKPLKGKKHHTLYAKKQKYKFKADGLISSLEFLDSTHLLVLERSYHKNRSEAEVVLSAVDISSCEKKCEKQLLWHVHSKKDKDVDNYEGLTKLDSTHFLMVSDNNENPKQRTLLRLFEVRKD